MTISCDPDARWLKKGNRSYFGYKAFVCADAKHGFIMNVDVTPANVSEVRSMELAIGPLRPARLYADKGYASAENRELLGLSGIKDGIMHKAVKNKPLTKWQKLFNRMISRKRYPIEQAFGTLKRRFKLDKASYMTLAKVRAEALMKAIASNLLKAAGMLEV